jgi:hypothetical protein
MSSDCCTGCGPDIGADLPRCSSKGWVIPVRPRLAPELKDARSRRVGRERRNLRASRCQSVPPRRAPYPHRAHRRRPLRQTAAAIVRCGEATLPEVSETSRLDPGDLLELGVPPVPTPKPTRWIASGRNLGEREDCDSSSERNDPGRCGAYIHASAAVPYRSHTWCVLDVYSTLLRL